MRHRPRSGLVGVVRDRAQLHRGHAGELCGPEDPEALHRLDVTGAAAPDAGAGRDREDERVRQRCTGRREQPRVGIDAFDPRQREAGVDQVAVDGLRAEHERGSFDPAPAGDADVQERVRPPLRQRLRRLQRRLHRPDPAAERLRAADELQLPLGCCHDEHHGGDATRCVAAHRRHMAVDPPYRCFGMPKHRYEKHRYESVPGREAGETAQAGAGAAMPTLSKTSSASRPSSRTVSPSPKSPSSSRRASGFSTRRWIARFRGRAP